MFKLTVYVGGYSAPKASLRAARLTGGSANTSAEILPAHSDEAKEFASVRARAALLGHTLQRYGDTFLIGRWGQTCDVDSLPTAARWRDRIGGKP